MTCPLALSIANLLESLTLAWLVESKLGVPLSKLTAALQKCYDKYFLPVWGYPVKLYNTKRAKPSDWQFVYFDDTDDASEHEESRREAV